MPCDPNSVQLPKIAIIVYCMSLPKQRSCSEFTRSFGLTCNREQVVYGWVPCYNSTPSRTLIAVELLCRYAVRVSLQHTHAIYSDPVRFARYSATRRPSHANKRVLPAYGRENATALNTKQPPHAPTATVFRATYFVNASRQNTLHSPELRAGLHSNNQSTPL